MTKREIRTIITDIVDTDSEYANILNELSTQLSDGYWEGREDEPISDYCYWYYLEFEDIDGFLAIKVDTVVKDKYADNPNMFVEMTNQQVIESVRKTLKSRFEEAPHAICGRNDIHEETVDTLIEKLSLAKEIDTTKTNTTKTDTTKTSTSTCTDTDELAKALLNSITDMQNRIKELEAENKALTSSKSRIFDIHERINFLEKENKTLKSTLAKVKALL